MAIHVSRIEEWSRLAREARCVRARDPADGGCPRCAELGAAVLALVGEIELLRAPYARAFRDGVDGALDFAARTFSAMGERDGARVLRDLRAVTRG
ncbi:MAG TPA: hypothetical protein VM753_23730 [Anaeromyxobacter sp.]|nr:hypothetical protein [Anaeromyxobacter sp.]